jgi:hypothetical protein
MRFYNSAQEVIERTPMLEKTKGTTLKKLLLGDYHHWLRVLIWSYPQGIKVISKKQFFFILPPRYL